MSAARTMTGTQHYSQWALLKHFADGCVFMKFLIQISEKVGDNNKPYSIFYTCKNLSERLLNLSILKDRLIVLQGY